MELLIVLFYGNKRITFTLGWFTSTVVDMYIYSTQAFHSELFSQCEVRTMQVQVLAIKFSASVQRSALCTRFKSTEADFLRLVEISE